METKNNNILEVLYNFINKHDKEKAEKFKKALEDQKIKLNVQ